MSSCCSWTRYQVRRTPLSYSPFRWIWLALSWTEDNEVWPIRCWELSLSKLPCRRCTLLYIWRFTWTLKLVMFVRWYSIDKLYMCCIVYLSLYSHDRLRLDNSQVMSHWISSGAIILTLIIEYFTEYSSHLQHVPTLHL